MGFSLDFHHGDYDCYSLRVSPSGSMINRMVYIVLVSIMSCSLSYWRRRLPFVLSLPFPYLPMFPCSCCHIKIANGNHHMSTFVYPVDDFTQAFIEICPDDLVLFRDYQGRSVSNK